MLLHLFHALVALHIVTGITGALAFWIPVLGGKGSDLHRRAGRLFARSMVATGVLACLMGALSLAAPEATHPHLDGIMDATTIRALFGVMMLHTGLLTINLAWYGLECARNGPDHAANRRPLNMVLQPLLAVAALICAAVGFAVGQGLMVGIAIVGLATALTNLHFLRKPTIRRADWLKEHIKALVGAGISVYTAFFAFGSVRVAPHLALSPALWAVPLVIGLAIIIGHRLAIDRQVRRAAAARGR